MEKSFLGTGWSFPPEFNKTMGGIDMVSDEEDIRQSIIIFLSTRIGERTLRPGYGNTLLEYVFAPVRMDIMDSIAEELKMSLRIYEPRILVHRIMIDTTKMTDGVVHFTVEYEVESTNVRNNIVFPYYLVEGTNITG
ncbi:MAG: hypothetical protein RJA52_964 [Bacteroidota bacterium]|jgi:phage baseplate assembly protein W